MRYLRRLVCGSLLLPLALLAQPAAPVHPSEWFARVDGPDDKLDLLDWIRQLPAPADWPEWLNQLQQFRSSRAQARSVSVAMLRDCAPELLLRTLYTPEPELAQALEPLLAEIERVAGQVGPKPGASQPASALEQAAGRLPEQIRALRLSLQAVGPRAQGERKARMTAAEFQEEVKRSAANERRGSQLEVPDLVAELGVPAATAILRPLFDLDVSLRFGKSGATIPVARQVALEKRGLLKRPPWDLCESFAGAELAADLSKRFPVPERGAYWLGARTVLMMSEAARGETEAALARWREADQAELQPTRRRQASYHFELHGLSVDEEIREEARAAAAPGAFFAFWMAVAREGTAGTSAWSYLRAEAERAGRMPEVLELAQRLRAERGHHSSRRAAAALIVAGERVGARDLGAAQQVWEAALADEHPENERGRTKLAILERWLDSARAAGDQGVLRAGTRRLGEVARWYAETPGYPGAEYTPWTRLLRNLTERGGAESGEAEAVLAALQNLPITLWNEPLTRWELLARANLAAQRPEAALAALVSLAESAAALEAGKPYDLAFRWGSLELLMARVLRANGRIDEASRALALALVLRPTDHEVAAELLEQPPKQAAAVLREVARLVPAAFAPRIALARLALRQGAPAEARQLVAWMRTQTLAFSTADSKAMHTLRAELAQAAGDASAAKASSSHAQALGELDGLMDSTRAGTSATALARLIEEVPGEAALYVTQALVLRRERKITEAKAAWARAVTLWGTKGPQATPQFWRMRRLFSTSEGRAFAEPAVLAALARPSPHPRIRLLGARLALASGRPAEAQKLLAGLGREGLEAKILLAALKNAPAALGRELLEADPVDAFVTSLGVNDHYTWRNYAPASGADQWRTALRVRAALEACGISATANPGVLAVYPTHYRRLEPAGRAAAMVPQPVVDLVNSLLRCKAVEKK